MPKQIKEIPETQTLMYDPVEYEWWLCTAPTGKVCRCPDCIDAMIDGKGWNYNEWFGEW